jgi:Protein of unknown function (DUF1822)
MNTSTQQNSFKVFLSYSAHDVARKRSEGIPGAEATKKVYLNSLATYAVKYYLDCMSFEVEEKDNNFYPWMESLVSAMYIEVKNIGKIKCLPVSRNAKSCNIPYEAASECVAYIFVQFNSELNEAQIIGFTPNLAPIVALNQLQSVDSLLEYLTQKEQTTLVNIRQWLEGLITQGWDNIENILNPKQLVFARGARFNITQATKIDLGLQLDSIPIALVARVTSEEENTVNIKFQVFPVNDICLPQGLELVVIDENGESVLNATSRANDSWVEVTLGAQFDEKFSVDIRLANSKVTQEFVV